MKRGGGRLAGLKPYDKGGFVKACRAIDSAGPRVQLQSQVVAGEIVQVVQGVLGQAQQVLGLLVLQLARLDGDAKGKDWTAGLGDGLRSASYALGPSRHGYDVERMKVKVNFEWWCWTYPANSPVHHVVQGQAGTRDGGRVPPYRKAKTQNNQPKRQNDQRASARV